MKLASAAIAALMLSTAAQAQDARFHYAGDMHIEPEAGRLRLDWTITAFEDDLERVTFALNPALGDVTVSGAGVASVEVGETEGFAGPLRTLNVTLVPSVGGADRDIAIGYAGPLFPEAPDMPINTLDAHKIELTVDSFWMPFDMRFESLITADLDIELAGDWAGVTMQSITRTPSGFHIDQDRPALDLAFTLMSDFTRVSAEGYDIFDTRQARADADLSPLVGALDFCTAFLNELAGEGGPLPRASITVNDRSEGGYSRGTLIALTDISESTPERLTQFICHELAHYWSHGNAMTVENWLNESFADQMANLGLRARFGEAAFEARMAGYAERISDADALPPVWTPDTTARPPYLVMYRAGPLALADLEAQIGRAAFRTFLRRYMAEPVRTTPQMLDLVADVAGEDARDWFVARLGE
jgi:hypothetical protein